MDENSLFQLRVERPTVVPTRHPTKEEHLLRYHWHPFRQRTLVPPRYDVAFAFNVRLEALLCFPHAVHSNTTADRTGGSLNSVDPTRAYLHMPTGRFLVISKPLDRLGIPNIASNSASLLGETLQAGRCRLLHIYILSSSPEQWWDCVWDSQSRPTLARHAQIPACHKGTSCTLNPYIKTRR
jgi:hypothetical protein